MHVSPKNKMLTLRSCFPDCLKCLFMCGGRGNVSVADGVFRVGVYLCAGVLNWKWKFIRSLAKTLSSAFIR